MTTANTKSKKSPSTPSASPEATPLVPSPQAPDTPLPPSTAHPIPSSSLSDPYKDTLTKKGIAAKGTEEGIAAKRRKKRKRRALRNRCKPDFRLSPLTPPSIGLEADRQGGLVLVR